MLPSVFQPGLLLIRPQYTEDPDTSDKPENVTWWGSATHTTPTLGQLEAIAAIFDTNWGALFQQYGATGKQYVGSITTDWSSDTGLVYDSVGTFSPVGGTKGAPLPPQVAVLMSFQSAQRFKGGHFRTYLPWVGADSQDSTDPSKITTTVQSDVTTAESSLEEALFTDGILGGQSRLFYRYRNDPLKAQLWSKVSFDTSIMLATQRRRIRRVAHR